jgi:ACT domain-containing protein
MQGYFTMMMVVDVSKANVPLAILCQQMDAKGQELGMSIRVQREDIFEAMHRV